MKQYHDLLLDILNSGETRGDRTGTGTISVFGRQLRFNLQEGFPAITTKKLAFNACKGELLWFLEGSSDERRLAEITHGTKDGTVTIWTPNALAPYWKPKAKFDGDLQKVYGYQWRKWGCYDKWTTNTVLIEQNTHVGIDEPFHIHFELEEPDFTNADDFVGKTFNTKYGPLIVLKNLGVKNKNRFYRTQFLQGINTICEFTRPNIKNNTVKNPYGMTAASGNGCYGVIDKRSPYIVSAYNMWLNMMERCHGNNPTKTMFYKDIGIFVEQRWRCFSNFYKDIHGLPGFDQWSKNTGGYDLDKDYHGNTFYGGKTTIFLPSWYNRYVLPSNKEGILYTATNKKTGEKFKFTSPSLFNKHTKTKGDVDRAFREQNGSTRSWGFIKETPPVGFKWRQCFYIDQIKRLIDGIKNDPNGRRHIVSAWNVGDLSEMALPPCHLVFQFYVSKDGKLSCHMLMRSVDVGLGISFNIASYALLTHMIAQVCDLDVGELVISTGDTHIYLDHVESLKEQLTREPFPLPKLWLNPEIKDIDKFTMDDIKLIGYQSHPPLKMKMAV